MPDLTDSQKSALDRITNAATDAPDAMTRFAEDVKGGSARETPPAGREPLRMSPPQDEDPGDVAVESPPLEEDVTDKADSYSRFAEHAGQPAADALREINQTQSEPTANDWAQVIRQTYATQYPRLVDDVTVGEVILEFTDLAAALEADENTSKDMDLEQVLALAVKNVLDVDAADDEIIGRLLDGERHLVPTQVRDRDAHAKKRRARAAELLGQHPQKTAANEEDRVLNVILDRAESGQSTGEVDRKSTGGRSIGFPTGMGMGQ